MGKQFLEKIIQRILNYLAICLSQQRKDGESPAKTSTQKRASAAQLRITKDINELNLPKTCKMEFPEQDDLLNFKLIISPDEVLCREILAKIAISDIIAVKLLPAHSPLFIFLLIL
ncbi:nedd8-conjugating enzyme UbcE2M [Trichonephila clavata]|uniref:Nedd8-conjugating enzyme UbcE2M n=1 Tax=Trichonephila clavata TaxID=2740835 RepID=A0A8X6G6Y3_TRICU|nr:nedd8-conjugating enzyme UbcE2M [Trichonephila clavata]